MAAQKWIYIATSDKMMRVYSNARRAVNEETKAKPWRHRQAAESYRVESTRQRAILARRLRQGVRVVLCPHHTSGRLTDVVSLRRVELR